MSLPRLRAPQEDGGILAVPPLAQVGELLGRNHRELSSVRIDILEKPLTALRQLARDNAWDAIRQYHAEAHESLPAAPLHDQPWLLAGHQPELFHPGVWAKNFALRGLAARHGAFSLNLIVDNDAAKTPLLHLPAGAHVATVPYDHWQGESPYEERRVIDEALFASLPERTEAHFADWPFVPLLPAFWQEVRRQSRRTSLLGERIAAARRSFERQWGCTPAEVPISRLCQGEAFAWFACHLLLNAPRLHQIYNDAVHAYRRRYRLRSPFHPVPDLATEGDWREVPLWAWQRGQKRRARLFVRQTATALDLRAGNDVLPSLALGGDPQRLVEQWLTLELRGFKVRTRALTTTLFARLLLADVFVHGIGGGKYDELTDHLFQELFGCAPPEFLVLTATRLLPLSRFPVATDTCRRLAREYRDLRYNPQRHFANDIPVTARDLIDARTALVGRGCTTHAERLARFTGLRELNERLQPYLDAVAHRLRETRDTCQERLRVNQIAGRRDYAFCLYPEDCLRSLFAEFAPS